MDLNHPQSFNNDLTMNIKLKTKAHMLLLWYSEALQNCLALLLALLLFDNLCRMPYISVYD